MKRKTYIVICDEAAPASALLSTSQSFDGIRCTLEKALQNVVNDRQPMDEKPDGTMDSHYCWIRDVFKSSIVYSMDGMLYQRDYKISAKGAVTFGDPMKVEVAYKPMSESTRRSLRESIQLAEAKPAYDKKTGKLTLTIIRSGMSKNKKYYPTAVLERDRHLFEGAKMFVNHQTDIETRTRPEGDVNAWAAQIGRTWMEGDAMKGEATVIDPIFKQKLENLSEANLLTEMGVSIRAIGKGSDAEVDGEKCTMVEGFIACRSVDFVTYAGAGGQVEALEADRTNDANDVDLLTVEALRARRPDLVDLVESNVREELSRMKSLEQQLQEANAALATANAKNAELETKIAESAKTAARANVKTELEKMLTESKLPVVAADKIRKQFAEAEKVDGIAEAIESEKQYIAAIAPAPAGKTAKNLGPDAQEHSESAGAEKPMDPKDLVESFKLLGMTEEEAKIAAGVK